MVATTNALVAFVVDSCAGAGKPTIAAESASIVETKQFGLAVIDRRYL